ncbi:spore protease YyaC [Paenibacillus segetis]|uniref:Spore protease YyaC n=1 Tax=Paenibacillus segetis TaxID=1325360 RepID=A0ABQ1YW90_9BACL|nr:spore protease YyaC [Paenibacillus segetis]GGH38920.1 hypothetical protein GCM10008013_47320 [Paenibacillus segetis]
MGLERGRNTFSPHVVQQGVKKISGDELITFFQEILKKHGDERAITFLCIGTDRSTGDSLGPLVGTRLEECGWESVVGSLRYPCDADNLQARIKTIPSDNIIVAIDAALGSPASVGHYLVSEKPIFPAKSVGTKLPAVGHYSIAAVVNVKSSKPYSTLQMTSLYSVMLMADEITQAITRVFGCDT